MLGGTGSVGRREAPVIEALGLGRTFGSKAENIEAVHDVSFTVRRGEIVGFLGSNGAGKTTMMRLLTTLLSPTAGDALVVGSSLRQDPRGVRRHIGYVAQRGSTHGDSRVLEQLVLQGRLHRMTVKQTRERAEELCEVLDLTDLVDRPAKVLSGGQRRRLDIALGLMHHPSLLILDEPTTGLDPQNRGTMWEHVRKLRHELGTTVFLTTHYLDEADELCDQILLMSRGTIVDTGTPDQLKRRISGDIVTLEINGYPEDA
ncbi:MAG: ABC transporter ATP-binding protein [Frankia sp.]